MDIVFQPSGNFDEVYLYVSTPSQMKYNDLHIRIQEELMEADLHAIVNFLFKLFQNFRLF